MSTLTIRKKSLKTWLHTDSILGDFIISKFYFNADSISFQIVEQGQSKRVIYNISDITLYALPTGGSAETFTTITELSLRLEQLNYPAFQYDGQITSIANLIDAGTNITITGDGTEASPYVISSTGGGGGSQNLQQVTDEGATTTNPITITDIGSDRNLVLDPLSQGINLSSVTEGLTSQMILDYIGTYNSDYSKQVALSIIGDGGLYIKSVGGTDPALIKANLLTDERNYELPDESGTIALLSDITGGGFTVISTNTTASNDTNYSVVANATFTDPSPTEGKGYVVFVRNGTATIGGVGYTAGYIIYRFFHSGAWSSTVYVDKVYVDAKVTDAIVDGVTTVAPSQNAVFDALALRKKRIIADTTSVVVSGTTGLVLAKTYELTAGTLSASGFLDVYMFSSRTGGSNAHSMGLYINTTNNFGTATLIATMATAGNFNPHLPAKLQYILKDNLLIGGLFSQTSGSNMPSSATRVSVACNNTSASVWLFVGVTLASGQTITLEGVEILN